MAVGDRSGQLLRVAAVLFVGLGCAVAEPLPSSGPPSGNAGAGGGPAVGSAGTGGAPAPASGTGGSAAGPGTGGAKGPAGGTGGATSGASGGAGVATGGVTATGGRPASPPPVFALPWAYDFEKDTVGARPTGWIPNPKDLVGKWAVAADGATKVLQETVAVASLSMVVGGDIGWTDQQVDVRVKIPVASTDVLALVAARFVDFDNYYFLHLKGDGSMKIRKRIMGSTTDLVTYKSGIALVPGTWYTMGFGFKGATVTAYLNGTAVGTMTEAAASHPAGGIALGVQDGMASFDDVKVTAPP